MLFTADASVASAGAAAGASAVLPQPANRAAQRTRQRIIASVFFIFSSSVSANPAISAFLQRAVRGREYWWGILLSQIISNVPAAIVLYPFTENLPALLYGVDSAGLCTLIGSLASVINYRIYVREYPGRGGAFIKVFTLTSLAFFVLVVIPGYLLSAWPM